MQRIIFKKDKVTFSGETYTEVVISMMHFSHDGLRSARRYMEVVKHRAYFRYQTLLDTSSPRLFLKSLSKLGEGKLIRKII